MPHLRSQYPTRIGQNSGSQPDSHFESNQAIELNRAIRPDLRSGCAMPSYNQVLPMTDPQIPKFTGNPADWPEWMLTWKSRVHNNSHLTDCRRLDLLSASLEEEPRTRIFALLWDERNYGRALLELEKIYGNASFVIDSYLQKIKSFPRVRNNSDLSGLCTKVIGLWTTFTFLLSFYHVTKMETPFGLTFLI